MSRLDVADFTLQTLRLRLYVTDFTSQASRRCQTLRRRLHVADFTRRDFTPQTLCRRLYVVDFALQRLHVATLRRGLYVAFTSYLYAIFATFG